MSITLKAMRVNRNLSRLQAAELLSQNADRKITVEILTNWETYRTYPDVRDIKAIEVVYDCSYNDINFYPPITE